MSPALPRWATPDRLSVFGATGGFNRLFEGCQRDRPCRAVRSSSTIRGRSTSLRAALRAAGFTGEGVRAVLGSAGELLSRSVDIPLHERRLEGVEPLGTLVKLLVLDAPVRVDEAAVHSPR